MALLAGAAYILFSQRNTSGTAVTQVFAYTDTAAIDKIVIEQRGSPAHTLTRAPGAHAWLLDGKIKTAPGLVQQMLATLHELKVKRPCTRAERKEVIKQMATFNFKIMLEGNGQQLHSFFLGSSTDEGQGNYALLPDAEEPVVVHLPNWQGYVSARFVINPEDWENKLLFGSLGRTLQQVSVSWPAQPAENFTLKITGKSFALATGQPLDSSAAINLILSLSGIYVETYLREPKLADSLARTTPVAIVALQDSRPGYSHTLHLYPSPYKSLDSLKNQQRILGYIADTKQAITLQPQNVLPLMIRKTDLAKQ